MKEQLGTRVEPALGMRLRVYAAVTRLTVAEVVSAALDSYLPPLADVVRDSENASDVRGESADGDEGGGLAPVAGGTGASDEPPTLQIITYTTTAPVLATPGPCGPFPHMEAKNDATQF